MAIYKLIANGSFGPNEIEAMSAAYESALVNLGIANRTVALQPISLQGSIALNVVAGVSSLKLRPLPL